MDKKHRQAALGRLNLLFDRLEFINERLQQLESELKAVQPHKPGAITLYLSGCGKDCLGCPHVSWELWATRKMPKGSEFNPFFSVTVKNPLRRLKRTGDFEDSFEKTRELIQEAENLLQEKSGLVESISRMNRKANGVSS